MIKNDLTLDYLKTFWSVATHGGMHRAAEERNMTQPAVTRQMAILSREVGTRLFERFGRGVRLTAAGEALLKETDQILRAVDEGLTRVRDVAGADRHRLSLGSSHYVASHGLAAPVRTFRARFPDVQIDFECGSSELIARQVREGRLDLGVATLPSRSEGLRRIPLWRDTFEAALFSEDSLAQGDTVSLGDLSERVLVLPPSTSTTRALIERALRRQRISPKRVIELATLEDIAAGVAMWLGVSILPRRLLAGLSPRFPEIAARPIRRFGESRELGILIRKGRVLRPSEGALIDLLREDLGAAKEE